MSMDINSVQGGSYQNPVQQRNTSAESAASVQHIQEAAAAARNTARVIQTAPNFGNNQGDGGAQPSDKDIKSAIEVANKQARAHSTNAQFAYHEDSKRISIKIVDNETNEVIKEIPSEETLEMISKLWDLVGMVVDERR